MDAPGEPTERQVTGRPLPLWLVLATFSLTAIPFVRQIPSDIVAGCDLMKYMVVARSIYEGNGLGPGAPFGSQYPLGWPLIMAGLFKLTGWYPAAAHLLTSLFCWATGPLVYMFLRRRLPPWLALLTAVYFGNHCLTVQYGDYIHSEPAFVFLFWAVLLLADARAPRSPLLKYSLLGAGCVALTAVRTAGIAVWLGLLAHCLVRAPARDETRSAAPPRTWRQRLAGAGLLSLPMLLYQLAMLAFAPASAVRVDEGYGGQFFATRIDAGGNVIIGVLRRTLADLVYHVRDMRVAMLPVDVGNSPLALLPKIVMVAVLLLAAGGCIRLLLARRDSACWAATAYLALCFIWPYFSARFIWPVVPLLVCWAILAPSLWRRDRAAGRKARTDNGDARSAAGLHRTRWAAIATGGLLAVAALASIAGATMQPRPQRERLAANQTGFEEAMAIISERGGTVATIERHGVHYYDRNIRVCPLRWSPDPETHLEKIRSCGANWVLGSAFTTDPLKPMLRGHPGAFKLVLRRGDVRLYAVTLD